jgi:hypothetical protein
MTVPPVEALPATSLRSRNRGGWIEPAQTRTVAMLTDCSWNILPPAASLGHEQYAAQQFAIGDGRPGFEIWLRQTSG